jgi:hypothetical protein
MQQIPEKQHKITHMDVKYRLLFVMFLLLGIYYTLPWFTINFIYGSVILDVKYLYTAFVIFYILLEYREYKQVENEFHHLFFWFFFITLTAITYLVTLQAFNYYIIPRDFLLNTADFKIQLIYTSEYMLYYLYKYLDLLACNVENIPNMSVIVQSVDIATIVCYSKTVDGLREAVIICLQMSAQVYLTMWSLIERSYETPLTESLFYCMRNAIAILGFLKGYANLFAYTCVKLIPYIKDELHQAVYRYLCSNHVEFDPSMTLSEIYDTCRVFAHHMLRKWDPEDIVNFFWKWRK